MLWSHMYGSILSFSPVMITDKDCCSIGPAAKVQGLIHYLNRYIHAIRACKIGCVFGTSVNRSLSSVFVRGKTNNLTQYV